MEPCILSICEAKRALQGQNWHGHGHAGRVVSYGLVVIAGFSLSQRICSSTESIIMLSVELHKNYIKVYPPGNRFRSIFVSPLV